LEGRSVKVEEKLKELGYPLPHRTNERIFEAGIRTGNLIFVSGNAAKVDGVLKYKGIVGNSVSVEQAQESAIIAFVNCLNSVNQIAGGLENVKKIVNIKGYVASTPDFVDQPLVMDAVSRMALEVFGDAGKHSRVAMGASSLPGGTPVEVEMVIEV
jgi:enamine deaminase RidA (YjgF/YER057c/UK114 family)